jgi:hypothetical protein
MKMDFIQMNIDHRGGIVEVKAFPEQEYIGAVYPVNMNDNYAFTIYNDDEEWGILREANGNAPDVDPDLYRSILKQLKWELQYDA